MSVNAFPQGNSIIRGLFLVCSQTRFACEKCRVNSDVEFIIHLSFPGLSLFTKSGDYMSIEKIIVENEQELEQMVTKEISQIEKDLTLICNHVPINDKTRLDILCHDGNGQLVVVQLDMNEDDSMLIRGLQSLDYLNKFKSFLKATYNKHKIDDTEKPRLILIAPSFSDPLRHAVESMKGMRIDLYEWEYLKLGDHKGLRLQPIFAGKPNEKPREEDKPLDKRREQKPTRKKEPAFPTDAKEEPKNEPPKDEQPKYSPPPLYPEFEKPKDTTQRPPQEEQKKKLKLF